MISERLLRAWLAADVVALALLLAPSFEGTRDEGACVPGFGECRN